MRPAQGGGRHFGQTDRAYLAGALQLRQRAHAFLDGHRPVPAMQVVHVDDVGAQSPQRVFAGLLQGLGAAVDDPLHAGLGFHTLHAALAGQGIARTRRRQGAAHQLFVGAEAV